MRHLIGKAIGFGRVRDGSYMGQFLIPPSFDVSGEAILLPLRDAVQQLYAQLPPDLQAPFTPELLRCNELSASAQYSEAQACYEKLLGQLGVAVKLYHKIPLEPTDKPSNAPYYLLGGTALVGLLILLA